MNHATVSLLTGWQNFYVIVGSAAGALTGLQFIVITLMAQGRSLSDMQGVRAFGTPTVTHFCAALLISAAMTAPWPSLPFAGIFLGVFAAAGCLYSLRVVFHARKAEYDPDLEDWIWYTALPLVAHLTLLAGAILLYGQKFWSLFIVAADALLFLLIGLHNSWDTVTYIAVKFGKDSDR